jgi:hypothetical protein
MPSLVLGVFRGEVTRRRRTGLLRSSQFGRQVIERRSAAPEHDCCARLSGRSHHIKISKTKTKYLTVLGLKDKIVLKVNNK